MALIAGMPSLPEAPAVLTAKTLAAFVLFASAIQDRRDAAVRSEFSRRGAEPGDVEAALAEDRLREAEFIRFAVERLKRDLPAAARSGPAAVQRVLDRERRYARQRTTASLTRISAAVDRAALRTSSPTGAWYVLGSAKDHTSGCLTGDMPVTARGVLAASRRFYEGVVVEVTTASGQQLTLTPNHPVLTARGWVAAGLLNEEDDLFNCGVGEGLSRSVDVDLDDGPSTAEEVYTALEAQAHLLRAQLVVGAEDFHGDGRGGYVDVIRANGSLLEDVIPALGQGLSQLGLMVTDSDLVQLSCQGGTGAGRQRVGTLITDGAQGLPGAPQGLRDVVPVYAQPLGEGQDRLPSPVGGYEIWRSRGDAGLAPGPRLNSEGSERLDNLAAVYPVSGAQADSGLAVQVAPDHLIRVRRLPYRGHVYNFETLGGWYKSGQLTVHNCVFMAGGHTAGSGRFWPWQVLDRVHPPRHGGCTAHLQGYGWGVARGLLTRGSVMDVADAIRAAAHVVMEGDAREAAVRLARELEGPALFEALLSYDAVSGDFREQFISQYVRGA